MCNTNFTLINMVSAIWWWIRYLTCWRDTLWHSPICFFHSRKINATGNLCEFRLQLQPTPGFIKFFCTKIIDSNGVELVAMGRIVVVCIDLLVVSGTQCVYWTGELPCQERHRHLIVADCCSKSCLISTSLDLQLLWGNVSSVLFKSF